MARMMAVVVTAFWETGEVVTESHIFALHILVCMVGMIFSGRHSSCVTFVLHFLANDFCSLMHAVLPLSFSFQAPPHISFCRLYCVAIIFT